ncbi:hypothetical protein QAD02_015826 [Eretmocerus hayati]|uniref:Uncharacterized protein n=1 Tax=Eretmocerus hayati TaxID=131215 RepID=A0ACC2P9R8_9HYME|nr:hypothetical protein QAD02_015826 [Eretmocerus hayati]
MPRILCVRPNCNQPAVLKRARTGDPMCKECFFFCFEEETHNTIINGKLFKKGDRVAIGASGGKDSTVLAYTMKLLNERYNYGLDLFLLSIDEGISGYRDDSLETVKQNKEDYGLPLKILSYKDLYGWTMDEIVKQIGPKNNCTFCGVFRRQALDRGAALVDANIIVTGHNADDAAETVIMNILRGDLARLLRCTNVITEGEGTIPRCKPLMYAYEKEIVMYAHFKKLVYFSTECIYSPQAYRGYAREIVKELERIRPHYIIDIIQSGEIMKPRGHMKFPRRQNCTRCGFVASQEICKACVLLEGLNTGNPRLGVTKSNKARRIMGLEVKDGSENKSKVKNRNPNKRSVKRERKKASGCGGTCSSECASQVTKPPTEQNTDSVPCSTDIEDNTEASLDHLEFSEMNLSDFDEEPSKKEVKENIHNNHSANKKTDSGIEASWKAAVPRKEWRFRNRAPSKAFNFELFFGFSFDDIRPRMNLDTSSLEKAWEILSAKLEEPKSLENGKSHSPDFQVLNEVPSLSEVEIVTKTKPKRISGELGKAQTFHNEASDPISSVSSQDQSYGLSHFVNQSSAEPLTVVAAPKNREPSLITPKMMKKAPNILDF